MRLVFLDSAVLFTWILHRVSETTGRQLTDEADRVTGDLARNIKAYRSRGAKLACTMDSAGWAITHLYKNRSLPFAKEYRGFSVRKSFASKAAEIVRRETTLLFPTLAHFIDGERLWFLYCEKGSKEQYGQFSDYIDSALIIDPPDGQSISVAMLGHAHVHYVLLKEKSHVQPNIVDKILA